MLKAHVYLIPLLVNIVVSMDNPKPDEEVFAELFMSEPQRRLHQGDTRGAKSVAHAEDDSVFDLHEDRHLRKKLDDMFEDEVLTKESYQAPRFESLDQAKEAFKVKDKLTKEYDADVRTISEQIEYLEGLQKSAYLQTLNSIYGYAPSMIQRAVSYIDPRTSPPLDTLHESKRQIERDIAKRSEFIESHPKWFLKKLYYKDDQFGLEATRQKWHKNGKGQNLAIIDDFPEKMPSRLMLKCKNLASFPDAKKNTSFHGVAVASVAVDSEIGVAPGATFSIFSISEFEAKKKGPFATIPGNIKHVIDFQGTTIERHHLEAIEKILDEGVLEFGVKLGESTFGVLDLSRVQVPKDEVINMSFGILDTVGNSRNSVRKQKMIYFFSFAVMMVQFARAGKLMVWAAGNFSMIIGASNEVLSLTKALRQHRPESFIIVLALDTDYTSLSCFTNQPGKHDIWSFSLCAPGTKVKLVGPNGNVEVCGGGTSIAAPFVSGSVLLLKSNFPDVSVIEIQKALLFSATPVVMKPIPSRFGEFPVVLRGIMSGELISEGLYTYFATAGTPKKIFVTREMINMGRERYGVGIINISNAYDYLKHICQERAISRQVVIE